MQHSFVPLNHGKISVLSGGNGPNIVFLHGAIATAMAYERLFKMLTPEYRVMAPTHPGHGDSFAISEDWKLEQFIRTYLELFSTMQIVPEIIMGHSFGGMLALLLGKYFPESKILVMDASGLPLTLTVSEYAEFMVAEIKALYRKRPDLEILRDAAPVAGTLVSTVVRHPEEMLWMSKHITHFDITDDLKRISNKTALFWGEYDAIVPLEIGEKMRQLIGGSKLRIFHNMGHIYPVVEAGMTYQAILDQFREWGLT